MTRAYPAALLLSAAAFFSYGIACLAFDSMRRDFERFGMSRFRVLTGVLEVLGALGLLVGWARSPTLVAASAGGLALLMAVWPRASACSIHWPRPCPPSCCC